MARQVIFVPVKWALVLVSALHFNREQWCLAASAILAEDDVVRPYLLLEQVYDMLWLQVHVSKVEFLLENVLDNQLDELCGLHLLPVRLLAAAQHILLGFELLDDFPTILKEV